MWPCQLFMVRFPQVLNLWARMATRPLLGSNHVAAPAKIPQNRLPHKLYLPGQPFARLNITAPVFSWQTFWISKLNHHPHQACLTLGGSCFSKARKISVCHNTDERSFSTTEDVQYHGQLVNAVLGQWVSLPLPYKAFCSYSLLPVHGPNRKWTALSKSRRN